MTDYIYVTLSTFAEYDAAPRDRLAASGVRFAINPTGKRITPGELVAAGRDASVLIAGVERYDAATIEQLPALRCISRCGAGVDAIDLAAARARGIAVVNTPDVPTQAVAELTLAMMLGLVRQLPRQSDLVHRREWTRLDAHLLSGRTVGLIGFGRIGRRVAALLAPFDTRIRVTDPHGDRVTVPSGVEHVDLDELLRTSDIVSIHAAAAGAGTLALGARELALMKPGALLINVARGTMVDEQALVAALRDGRLGGAALDVYASEPYAGPLCDFPNVILTPHSATLTVETRVAMELECVDKAIRFVTGQLAPEERIL
jgi:D-3-phosphoglycerate dehydrogenase